MILLYAFLPLMCKIASSEKKIKEIFFFGQGEISGKNMSELIDDKNLNIYDAQKSIQLIRYYQKWAHYQLRETRIRQCLLFDILKHAIQ